MSQPVTSPRVSQPASTVSSAKPRARWTIDDLVGRYGVASTPQPIDRRGRQPSSVSVYTSFVADLKWLRNKSAPEWTGGAGRAIGDPALARRIAACEAVERYTHLFGRPADPVVATGRELGNAALPLDEVARCSSAELRRPGCQLVLPDLDAKIRWTEGVELVSREQKLVPLTMARLTDPICRGEMYWIPISTGCAVHRTQIEALLGGLYEVIERDALAVAWLRRIALPRLDPAVISAEVEEIMSWYRSRGVKIHLYDATTDVPIPAVICVFDSPHSAGASQNIGSAAGFDLPTTVLKAVLEGADLYTVASQVKAPRRYRDFKDPIHNAVYMASASRRKAFSFWLDGVEERSYSLPDDRTFTSAENELAHNLAIFGEREMSVYATDITSREAELVGFSVAQVIIPALQPASLNPQVQFRGHSRLKHKHPAATGVQRMADLNRWPLPLP